MRGPGLRAGPSVDADQHRALAFEISRRGDVQTADLQAVKALPTQGGVVHAGPRSALLSARPELQPRRLGRPADDAARALRRAVIESQQRQARVPLRPLDHAGRQLGRHALQRPLGA
ncbi:hypothetical protein DAPPUDRAFT_279523 [Daphnia pulex]|uniref:Uncharacterized protein n=1 Tax=Daphnia pulex TaxID=6669 RepID=E9I7G0_DAPPU|nr:hypothetical protein DAPPUDRAFT_279523 [Daphnia pulex]|eukprot:EFX60070.1 hypothetical protein DAPPUDRAFT_279523 [Daphnia pulex]